MVEAASEVDGESMIRRWLRRRRHNRVAMFGRYGACALCAAVPAEPNGDGFCRRCRIELEGKIEVSE
jgi:hypothetical protein